MNDELDQLEDFINEHKNTKEKEIEFSEYNELLSKILQDLKDPECDVLDTVISNVNDSIIEFDDFICFIETQPYVIKSLQKLLHTNNICKYIEIEKDYY